MRRVHGSGHPAIVSRRAVCSGRTGAVSFPGDGCVLVVAIHGRCQPINATAARRFRLRAFSSDNFDIIQHMSITINLPGTIEKRVTRSAAGLDLERLFLSYLEKELERREQVEAELAELDDLSERVSSRLSGPAYRFKRADAYDESELA